MSETFRFALGAFSCLAIQDNTARYPSVMFLTNLAKDIYEPLLRTQGQNAQELELSYTCLFIDTGQYRVLLDTGIGAFSLGPNPGKLLALLRAEGIQPEEIDTVILSHGHLDHIGGSLDEAGKPAFPRARYVMLRKEWDYWSANPSLAELALDENFKSYIRACPQKVLPEIQPQVDLIQPEAEIVPGITALAAYGHSPGLMAIEITSDGRRLLFVSDVVILPLHLEYPETISVVDHLPSDVVATRIKLLEKAAEEKSLVSTSHFPFPGLGYAVREAGSWVWRPMEIASAV